MTTFLTARHVLAHDGRQIVELRDAVVVIEGDAIVAVEQGEDAAAMVAAAADDSRAEIIDLGNSLLMPGLIDLDALTDIDHLNLDSWWHPEHDARLNWSSAYAAAGARDVLSEAERSTLRRYALVQLVLHGITSAMPIATEVHSAWAETHDDLLDVARTASELGLRIFLGPSYRSAVHTTSAEGAPAMHWDEARGWAGFRDAVRFLDTADALQDPLVTGILAPCRVETVAEDVLRATAEESARRGTLVRAHATQELSEREIIRERYDATPLEHLASVGLLNDRLILAHGVYLDVHPAVLGRDTGELSILAGAGVSIVHCPLTNARYAFLLEKLSQYLAQGVNIALGTDSFPPDLIRAIDTGVQTAKAQHGSLGSGLLAEYIEAATLGGARALHRGDLGRIAEGSTADLVAFSLDDFRFGVTDDPVRTLVLSGTARDAHFSMVNGRVTMRDSVVPGVDLDELARDGQRIFEKLRAAYAERDYLGGTERELFPPLFPAGS